MDIEILIWAKFHNIKVFQIFLVNLDIWSGLYEVRWGKGLFYDSPNWGKKVYN